MIKKLNLFKKSISPLIATILLIVVAVVIIAIIISWGRTFTDDSLNLTNIDLYTEYEISFYLKPITSLNGRTIFEYNPPLNFSYDDLEIIGYGLLGYTDYIVPLKSDIRLDKNQRIYVDHGISLNNFDLILYLNNKTMVIKNISQEIKFPNLSDCPEGFIPVPGNHLYNTMSEKGGFCVAKYEMKMDYTGDGIGNLVLDFPDCNSGSLTVNTWGYDNCPDGHIVSTPQGSPLVKVTHEETIFACESIGGSLITNNEWMTIARNIELVSENWSENKIGRGFINIGHSDNDPPKALEASLDDLDGYYDTNNIEGNQKRTHVLSNK